MLDGQTGRWQFGQVPLLAGQRFQLVVEGASYNGGYTLDDFKIYDGLCASEWKFDSKKIFMKEHILNAYI